MARGAPRAVSSAGRASRLHREGRRFEPVTAHHSNEHFLRPHHYWGAMAGDRAFENQFQWEVDRWVFRNRHRGEPIEVTPEERDRIIGLHRQRMATGARIICGIPLISPFVLGWDHFLFVPVIVIFSMFIGIPALIYWGHADTVKRLKASRCSERSWGRTEELHGRRRLNHGAICSAAWRC